jgi:fatty acid-binding protein DegV
MSKIALIVDSSSGITNGKYPDVYVLPLIVTETIGSKINTYKDGVNLDNDKLCRMLESGSDIKTSQANISEMIELAEKLSKEYDQIFVLPIPPTLSSNYNS